MSVQLGSSAAKRIANQLEYFLTMNTISVTDTMSIKNEESKLVITFYRDYKHKFQKYKIIYSSKPLIKLIREFYQLNFYDLDNDQYRERVALTKLLRVLPIANKKLNTMLSEITKIQKDNYHKKIIYLKDIGIDNKPEDSLKNDKAP